MLPVRVQLSSSVAEQLASNPKRVSVSAPQRFLRNPNGGNEST